MSFHFGLRETTGGPDRTARFSFPEMFRCAGVLVCVLLVLLTGFVAVAHFHANRSGSADRSCSLCALAHAGVAPNSISQPLPVPARVWPKAPRPLSILFFSFPLTSFVLRRRAKTASPVLALQILGATMSALFITPLRAAFLIGFLSVLSVCGFAQSAGNSTSVEGTVLDPSGAVVPNATVEIRNPVSQFERTTTTNSTGGFSIPNVPFNPYHLMVKVEGFAPYIHDIDVRSLVPVSVTIKLQLESSET